MNREVAIRWLDKIAAAQPGESIFLAVETRQHAKEVVKALKNELRILSEIDAVKANRIQISVTLRDQRYWVELQRTFGSPLVGFKKGPTGKLERIELEDPDRWRRLTLMKDDGFSLEDAEAIEGELTQLEKEIFS